MTIVNLGPDIFSIPSQVCGVDLLNRYIETLINWHSLETNSEFHVCTSEETPVVLQVANAYPIRNDLQDLFNANSIVEYTVKDIATIVDHLLSRVSNLESIIGIKYLLVTNETTDLDCSQYNIDSNIIEEIDRILLLLGSKQCYCDHTELMPILALSQELKFEGQINISAKIEDVEYYSEVNSFFPETPFDSNGQVLCCYDYNTLIKNIDECQVWCLGDELNKILAIKIRWLKLQAQSGVKSMLSDCPKFTFGKDFLTSSEKIGFCHESSKVNMLLDTIVDVFLARKMNKVHTLRLGKGPEEAQSIRSVDQAKAWRRDLDYEYHLHYWKKSDNECEFANVVMHNDYKITY